MMSSSEEKSQETSDFTMNGSPKIAYFSMEIGINERIPTYSGGLGVLAGDTLKSCADLNIPIVGITLLSENGYFYQKIDEHGNQIELPYKFNIEDFLEPLPTTVTVPLEGREVKVKIWYFTVKGINDYLVPVFFLDTNVEGNSDWDRSLTKYLYGGDLKYRLAQEIILGIGGVRAVHKLGYRTIEKYHMNEGHAAFGTLELYKKFKNIEDVRKRCVFTTHTPVPAGHDQFDLGLARSMLGEFLPESILPDITFNNLLNMTRLALFFSNYVNGVAKKHGEVSRQMFPGHDIDTITNGVNTQRWVSDPFQRLFDKHIPFWRSDPYVLRSALGIDKTEIWDDHMQAKRTLIDFINNRYNVGMNYDYFTMGFARRQTSYKRPELLVSDPDRLREMSEKIGPELIFG